MKNEVTYKTDVIKAVSEAVAYGGGFIDILKAIEKLPSAEVVSREEYEKQERVIEGLQAIIDNYKNNFIRLNDAYMEQINTAHKPDYSYEADMVRRLKEAQSAEAAQGVGRYEKAMQKLQEMPKYLNDIKIKQIKKMPSEAAQGKWIYKTNDKSVYEEWECSKCGCKVMCKSDFCPHCGARMFKEDGEAE